MIALTRFSLTVFRPGRTILVSCKHTYPFFCFLFLPMLSHREEEANTNFKMCSEKSKQEKGITDGKGGWATETTSIGSDDGQCLEN